MAAAQIPSLYEPINEYKPFAPGIGIVDGPFEYLTIAGVRLTLPFTTRMTVVKLDSGDLFLHSPVAFDAALARHLQSMGTIRHLVSSNQFHYAHIGEWSRAFPEAITWASPGARQRARARRIDVQFEKELGSAPPAEWRNEIDQTAIPGGFFGEIIFFHKVSKALILTDTIINLELDKIDQPWRLATRITGMYHAANSFLECAFRFCCRERRHELPWRRSYRGTLTPLFSAMGVASRRAPIRFSSVCSTELCKNTDPNLNRQARRRDRVASLSLESIVALRNRLVYFSPTVFRLPRGVASRRSSHRSRDTGSLHSLRMRDSPTLSMSERKTKIQNAH